MDFIKYSETKPRFLVKLFKLATKVIYYLYLDRSNRGKFNIVFYHNYSGTELEILRNWGAAIVSRFWHRRLFLEAIERIKYHKTEGHKIFIITGTLDIIVSPLASFLELDGWVAAQPEIVSGKLTGKLINNPISGIAKREAVLRIAETQNIDLSKSFAYGDSQADLELLGTVSHPIGVNPDRCLKEIARKNNWETVIWQLKYLT